MSFPIIFSLKHFTSINFINLADGSLVKLGCIYDNGDGLKFCEDPDKAPKEANIVVGAIVKIPPIESDPTKQISRFVPGHMVGTLFTPGQKVASDNGASQVIFDIIFSHWFSYT